MNRYLAKSFIRHIENYGVRSAIGATITYVTNNTLCSISRLFRLTKLRIKYGSWDVIKQINKSKMCLDMRPFGPNKIERTLALADIREPGATAILENTLEMFADDRDSIYVFDIGGNVGYFTLLEANILGDKGNIVAIEADPDNAERLKQNINLNNYSNVDVFQIAAGAEETELQLGLRGKSNIHQMTEVLDEKNVEKINVQVKSIDHLIKEREIPPDELIVIRMDVEGYEAHVVQGMTKLLSSDQPLYVMMEIHPDSVNVQDVIEPFRNNRFETEYVSYDGGNSFETLENFDKIQIKNTNSHLVLKRII